jgi:hypothetical protein
MNLSKKFNKGLQAAFQIPVLQSGMLFWLLLPTRLLWQQFWKQSDHFIWV